MSKPKSTTLKYLVVGDSGVGKTSLLVRYCDDTFQTDYLSTIGVDFKIKRIQHNGQPITLNIWDTAGQQRFRNITKSFYKGAHGIVLTYSIIDPISYQHIEKWVQQIREAGNADITMMLVGSKSDLKDERKVSYQQGQELAERYGMDFLEASAKQDSNIADIFNKLTDKVMKNQGSVPQMQHNSVPLQSTPGSENGGKKWCC